MTVKAKRRQRAISMPDLVDHICALREQGKSAPVLVAFCFSDELALKACLIGCRETRSIPVVMATTNQVNTDGGYAGIDAAEFVRKVRRLAKDVDFEGPVVFGRDHGGPYVIAAQKDRPRPEVMEWVKQNIRQDLDAGFTCWHADGTSGRDDERVGGTLPLSVISDTTLELIACCEETCKSLDIGPISYEVGSEEQTGGLTAPDTFEKYLFLLTRGIHTRGLASARIDFMVAQTGTHMQLTRLGEDRPPELIQSGFKPQLVRYLDRIAGKFRKDRLKLLFTQHYSDHITPADAAALLKSGAGKANFGPEMTMPEISMLLKWERQECAILEKRGQKERASGFRQTMMAALDRSPDFWHFYIPADARPAGENISGPSMASLSPLLQDALIVFRGRYVKSSPACAAAASRLLKNTALLGIDSHPEATVIEEIKNRTVLPRIRQFRMENLMDAVSISSGSAD